MQHREATVEEQRRERFRLIDDGMESDERAALIAAFSLPLHDAQVADLFGNVCQEVRLTVRTWYELRETSMDIGLAARDDLAQRIGMLIARDGLVVVDLDGHQAIACRAQDQNNGAQ